MGAGGLGRETLLLIHQLGVSNWRLKGFYDDGIAPGTIIDGFPILGTIADLQCSTIALDVVVSIADGKIRSGIVSFLTNPRLTFPSFVHPKAQLGSEQYNRLGRGCIITSGVILTTGITIEDFVIINLLSSIGHDVVLKSFSSIMPHCSISGNVKIGERSFIGTQATILQGLNIGDDVVIGAGAVITKDVDQNSVMIGVPGRSFIRR